MESRSEPRERLADEIEREAEFAAPAQDLIGKPATGWAVVSRLTLRNWASRVKLVED